MEVVYVKHGIANNFGTHIELNENLKNYPKLHNALLKHELSHTDKPGFTKEDFMLDMNSGDVSYKELFKFMVNHPKSLTQLMPFYIKDKSFIYDINMCIVWGVLLGAVGLTIFLTI